MKTQLSYMVSFRSIQLVQISEENTWKMRKIHDMIIDIFVKSLTLIYQVLGSELMLMIGTRSESPKEAIAIGLMP